MDDTSSSIWEEYLESTTTFVQYYRCRPISLLDEHYHGHDDGNRIIMPPSALERLGSLNVEYPMMFQIMNPAAATGVVVSHCGVLEFVADEGFVHVPSWIMARLGLQEGGLVVLKNTSLPRATFLRLQPHAMDFLRRVSNPRQLLEDNFRKYTCMTLGETITVTDGDRRYRLDVVEARPAGAVSTVETDCEVEFATPLDYKEPPKVAARPPPPAVNDDGGKPPAVARFTGVGMRLDGKPVEQQKTAADDQVAPAAGPSSVNGKRVLRFGGASAMVAGGGAKKEEEMKAKKEVEWFVGKKYSLMDSSMDE